MFIHEKNEYLRKVGSRDEVWNGIAYCTSGKLTKQDLIQKNGKLISKKRSMLGTERFKRKNPFKPQESVSQVSDGVEPVVSAETAVDRSPSVRQKRPRKRRRRK